MKNNRLTLSLAGIAALVSLSCTAIGADKTDRELCGDVATKTTQAVTAAPEDVLKIVAAEVAAAPKCACEVVKAAITASKADKGLVMQIVAAAVEVAADQLPNIIACAVDVAPEAAADIANKYTLAEGSGKGVVGKESYGKAPKGPLPPVEEEEWIWDFGLLHPGVGGIYLTTPGGGSVRRDDDDDDDDDDEETRTGGRRPRPSEPISPGGS